MLEWVEPKLYGKFRWVPQRLDSFSQTAHVGSFTDASYISKKRLIHVASDG